MKKRFLSFGLLALTSVLAQAQVTLITRAGVSLATIQSTSAGPDRQYAAGWVGGAGLNLPLGKGPFVSLQPEVLFAQKGFRMNGDRHVHNYLEVPLLLKVSLKREGLQTYLTAGPTAGFLLGGVYPPAGGAPGRVRPDDLALRMGDVLDGLPPWSSYAPATTALNRLELGFQVGVGTGLALGRGTALAELRYGQGLTPFFRTEDPEISNRFTNRAFGLTLGYALPLGAR